MAGLDYGKLVFVDGIEVAVDDWGDFVNPPASLAGLEFTRYGVVQAEHIGDFKLRNDTLPTLEEMDDLVASIWRTGNVVGVSGYHIGREFESIKKSSPFAGFSHKELNALAVARMKELTE